MAVRPVAPSSNRRRGALPTKRRGAQPCAPDGSCPLPSLRILRGKGSKHRFTTLIILRHTVETGKWFALPFAMTLEIELATYRAMLPVLKADEGKFVLIRGEEIAGTFNSWEEAVRYGYERFKLDPFLVKHIH